MSEYDGAERSTTERLRQLLDERGVEWQEPDPYQDATAWVGSNNIEYVAHEGISFDGPTGRLILFCLTPEQAVEATLVRGTCRMELPDLRGPAYTDVYVCSECGGEVMVGTVMGVSDVPKWCPWCGRKVEQ